MLQIGLQTLSENADHGSVRFPTDKRFRKGSEESDNPTGPGQYPVIKAKMETLSGRRAPFVMGLPHATRDRPVYLKVRPIRAFETRS